MRFQWRWDWKWSWVQWDIKHLLICTLMCTLLAILVWKEILPTSVINTAGVAILLWYTIETYRTREATEATMRELIDQTELSRKNQMMMFLFKQIEYYNDLREDFKKIFQKEANSELQTNVCNSLDNIGQITYRLDKNEREILLERFAEAYIRLWVVLRGFVEYKRKYSLKRDYPFFE